MLLNWPQKQSLFDDLRTTLKSTPTQDILFLEETFQLLDDCKNRFLSEEECENCKKLAKSGDFVVLSRYLDLQLGSWFSEEEDDLFSFATRIQESWLLANALCKHVLCPEEGDFLNELSLKWVQKAFFSYLNSLKIKCASEMKNIEDDQPLEKMRQILRKALKDEGPDLLFKDRLFLEDLLKGMEQNKESISYLVDFFSALEQLNFWEERIQEILQKLLKLSSASLEVHEISTLKEQLASFEREILSFHEDLGQHVSHMISSGFSEAQKAIMVGKFRRGFHEINNAYGDLKGKLLKETVDEHLCCMCHFSKNISMNWPIKNAVVDIHEGNPPTLPKFEKTSSFAQSSKASILIFTCGGGAGHLSATKAMGQCGEGKYHILVASTLEETLASSDILRKLTFDFTQEKLYNNLLKNEEFEWIKLITSLGPFFFMMQQKKIEHLMRLEVLKQRPDMLISCFPLMNSMLLNVAKEFNLPILIVTTDLDTGHFLKGMSPMACDLNYSNYKITLAYENPEMRQIIESTIPKEHIDVAGFPVRPAFNKEFSKAETDPIRKKYQIKDDEKVILVMMGGNAGRSIENYAEIFADCTDADLEEGLDKAEKLHVICLCGDQRIPENQEMLERINHLNVQSPHLTIKAFAATSEVAKLMSITDVLITKPGGCTTNEALAQKLPMIFHAPFALMDWEVFNMKFCIQVEMGARFKIQPNTTSLFNDGIKKNKKKLLPLVKDALCKKQQLKDGFYPFEKKDFGKEFLRLVTEMLPNP